MATPLSGFPKTVSLQRQPALPAPREAAISGHEASLSSPALASGLQALALSNQVRFGMAGSDPTVSASAPKVELSEAEAAFKAICDTVVGTEGTKNLTVADMLIRLCHKKEGYPGYGTVKTLSEAFPGLNTTVLTQCFEKLHNQKKDPCYLGQEYTCQDAQYKPNPEGIFWLRPIGEELIVRLYPGLDLPPTCQRYTPDAAWVAG